jgi:phosphatidylserine/phosphatidylglycerophosphate/cardiolipin synthase-like enzyme
MANTGVIGRVIDAVTNQGIGGLTIKAYDIDPFASETQIGKTVTTNSQGVYTISYTTSAYRSWFSGDNPDIEVRVFGDGGRLLHESPQVEDVTATTLSMPDIEIHPTNLRVPDPNPGDPDNSEQRKQDPYWLVTHTTLDSKSGRPVRLTNGNRVEWLIDGANMFPKVNEDARRGLDPRPIVHSPPPPPPPPATPVASIRLINMAFEKELASHFTFPPTKDYKNVSGTDLVVVDRLAEILKKQADANHVPVHVLVWELEDQVGGLLGLLLSKADGADELREFFSSSAVRVGSFKSTQLLHSKFILLDGKIAYLVGSTMKQGYFSGQDHLLRDGQHGVQDKKSGKGDRGLLHDASLKIEGPCVRHIDQTFSTIWSAHNENAPAPAPQTAPLTGTDVATVQLLRTLPGNIFTEPHANAEQLPHGETGVLEAYQRAIMKAEEYIYIEDQYFNSEEIVEAIKARMKERPQLEVILVLNPRPDIGGYHAHQTQLIKELFAAGGDDRLAVFSMWTCDPSQPKLEVAPIYVHSKVCIVDDQWVAIGTANVDGASMNARQWQIILPGEIQDFFDKGSITSALVQAFPLVALTVFLLGFVFPDIGPFMRDAARREFARFTQHANPNRQRQPPRHPEIELVVYDGIAGQPACGRVKDLREILWKEHLGGNLPATRPPEGWVGHWKHTAFLYLEKIKDGAIFGPGTRTYPEKVLKWNEKRDFERYLEELGVATGGIKLKSGGETMPFLFREALP